MKGRTIATDALQAVFTGTGSRPAQHTDTLPAMGSRATITTVGGSPDLVTEAFDYLGHCESVWSRFLPTSDVSRLNNAEGVPVDVDVLTVELIGRMREGASLTGGDFDPTLLPDLLAVGYRASTTDPSRVTSLPASARAPGALDGIGIHGTTVTMPLGTTIDPGGIGKGLAADLVCAFLVERGAWGAMAEVGGDIVVVGQAPDGIAWRLGIEDPFDPSAQHSVVRIAQGALVTSSQRKRRFTSAAGSSHHLVDPGTHVSAVTAVQAVSVIAATGARAEALTKPGFLRPISAYLDWLPTVGAAGLVFDHTGAVSASRNWNDYA